MFIYHVANVVSKCKQTGEVCVCVGRLQFLFGKSVSVVCMFKYV